MNTAIRTISMLLTHLARVGTHGAEYRQSPSAFLFYGPPVEPMADQFHLCKL